MVGGEVLDHRIFVFHGGWVVYDGIPAGWDWLPLYAGTIASCSLGLGMVVIGFRYSDSVLGKLFLVLGAGSFFQNAIYFLRSFHYGYGDGANLYTDLRETKDWLTLGCLPLLGVLAWRWTPSLLLIARKVLKISSGARLCVVLGVAFPLASLAFYHLGEAELKWQDPGFQKVMRPLEDRVVDERVSYLENEREESGEFPLTEEEIHGLEQEVEAEYGEHPFDLFLWSWLVVGCVLGLKNFLTSPMTDEAFP
jgi:hypothetical protein